MELFENYLQREIDTLQTGASVPDFTDADVGKSLKVLAASYPSLTLALDDNDIDGGTYTITFDGNTTTPIPWDDDGTQATTALEALPGIGPGNAVVSFGLNFGTGIDFAGIFFGQPVGVERVTADGSDLEGPSSPYVFTIIAGAIGGPLRLGWV